MPSSLARRREYDEQEMESAVLKNMYEVKKLVSLGRYYYHDNIFDIISGEPAVIEFNDPVKTKIIVVHTSGYVGVFYDPKGFEINRVEVTKFGDGRLVFRDSGSFYTETVNLVAHLLYSDGHDKLWRGEYTGNRTAADILVNIGELAKIVDMTMAPVSKIVLEDSIMNVAVFVKWNAVNWSKPKYLGLMVDCYTSCRSPAIVVANEEMRIDDEYPRIGIEDSTSRRWIFDVSTSKAFSLPPLQSLVSSFDVIKREVAKYRDAYIRAYVGTASYLSLAGETL